MKKLFYILISCYVIYTPSIAFAQDSYRPGLIVGKSLIDHQYNSDLWQIRATALTRQKQDGGLLSRSDYHDIQDQINDARHRYINALKANGILR